MISYPPTTNPQPPTTSTPPTESAEQARTNGRRYQIIFGSVFAALTVLALALAAIAPNLRPSVSQSAPANWSPVYQRDLTGSASENYKAWDLTKGCSFYSNGLYADASESDAAVCAFTPTGASGATASGFYFELGLAPAAQVPAFQRALLLVRDSTTQTGNGLAFEIDQNGQYVLCASPCAAGSGLYIASGTAAWHGDAFVANTIAMEVSADHSREIFYVNGQQVATASVDLGAQPELAVGASSGSGAVFTRATLSTGQ